MVSNSGQLILPFAADHDFLLKGGVLTKDQIERYTELKQEEKGCYRMTPHPVEFDMY
jgi:glutamine synthetase